MKNGVMENMRVRKAITESLFVLMEKKQFSDITVSDIVSEANIARASYYRNFSNKEEIVKQFMNQLHAEIFLNTQTHKRTSLGDNFLMLIENALPYLLKNKYYILTLYKNGLGSVLQETFNSYLEEVITEYKSTVDYYTVYFIAGAAFNILIKWLENGANESPREMAKMIVHLLSSNVLENNE